MKKTAEPKSRKFKTFLEKLGPSPQPLTRMQLGLFIFWLAIAGYGTWIAIAPQYDTTVRAVSTAVVVVSIFLTSAIIRSAAPRLGKATSWALVVVFWAVFLPILSLPLGYCTDDATGQCTSAELGSWVALGVSWGIAQLAIWIFILSVPWTIKTAYRIVSAFKSKTAPPASSKGNKTK